MLKIKIGNIFETNMKTLVNTVNCVGVMGKGIAKDFKDRYPAMFDEYVSLCDKKILKPGVPYHYSDLLGNSIINFPTKDHWKSPSKLSYIVEGLDWFIKNYKQLNIKSIAFPPLGCGNGGLNWEMVGPIMYKELKNLPIDVEIYAPFGTKTEQLSKEFLENNCIRSYKEVLGSKSIHFNEKWLLLPYIVRELNNSQYSLKVGRVIFQKICYVLTRTGVKTDFVFSKGSFGPYSEEVKQAVMVLSNANIIVEKQLGNMISIQVSDSFKFDESKYTHQELKCCDNTIDLLSRVKNTNQAELISTILFSADQFKNTNTNINELDVYNYVMDWKPQWIQTNAKNVSESIRNLAMMNWIKVSYYKELPYSNEFEI